MICKWCGEQIDSKTRVCPSCGHEIPPLSDFVGIQNVAINGLPENGDPVAFDTNIAKDHPVPKHIEIQKRKWAWVFIAALVLPGMVFTVSLFSLKSAIGRSVQQINHDLDDICSPAR